MDRIHYEILHTAQGASAADPVRALIGADEMLTATSQPWASATALIVAEMIERLV